MPAPLHTELNEARKASRPLLIGFSWIIFDRDSSAIVDGMLSRCGGCEIQTTQIGRVSWHFSVAGIRRENDLSASDESAKATNNQEPGKE